MARLRGRALLLAGVVLSALALGGCSPPVTVTIGKPAETPAVMLGDPPTTGTRGMAESSGQSAAPATGHLFTGWASLSQGVLRTPPATSLEIPALGISVPVEQVPSAIIDGVWQWPVPAHSAAHHLGTANPGEPGNIVLSGHVVTNDGPGVFAPLLQAAPGHEITLRSDAGTFTYRVESVTVVPETDTSVFLQVPSERLTLITCVPDGVYNDRVVVVARPVFAPTARVP